MDLSRLFIQNLKKWRKIKGFSQKKLAEKCETGYSYIRQIESGVGNPSFALLAKIAGALEIQPYQLFFDENAPPGSPAHEREAVEDILIKEVSGTIRAVFDGLAEAGNGD